MGDLSDNFSRSEFACRCGCGYDLINPELILLLQAARDMSDISFYITSGLRCFPHNMSIGGKSHSAHLIGKAVDIEAPDSRSRFIILRGLIKSGFNRIGIANSGGFIHADIANSNYHLPAVCWLY